MLSSQSEREQSSVQSPPRPDGLNPHAKLTASLPRSFAAYGYAALGVTLFAGTLPMTKMAMTNMTMSKMAAASSYAITTLPPLFITLGRAGLAGLLSLAVVLILRRPFPRGAVALRLILAGILLVGGFPAFANYAMVVSPAGHGGVILGFLPLMTSIVASIALRERPPVLFWILALLGAGLVAGYSYLTSPTGLARGDLLLAGAVAVCAFGYVILGDLSRKMPGWEVTSFMLVYMLPFTLPGTFYVFATTPLAHVGRPNWFGFAYVTILSQYVGFFFWNKGLAMGPMARVSQVQLLQSFVTLGFAALINGEHIDALTFGVAFLLVCLIAATRMVVARPSQ